MDMGAPDCGWNRDQPYTAERGNGNQKRVPKRNIQKQRTSTAHASALPVPFIPRIDNHQLLQSIGKDATFAVCRVNELLFRRDTHDNDALVPIEGHTLRELAKYRGCGIPSGVLHRSEPTSALKLLQENGYACRISTYRGFKNSTFWLPTEKVQGAMGHTILEEATHLEFVGKPLTKWTLVLGCREAVGIDAIVDTHSGAKVDFTWHWKNTEFGRASGLNTSNHQGMAFSSREGKIEKVVVNEADQGTLKE